MGTRNNTLLWTLVVFNLCIKLLWLGTNDLAHDEPFTVLQAHQSWNDLYAMLSTENNPPLYFIIMKLWVAVSPLDAGWFRIPSAVFSALIVWPLFLLGRAFGGIRLAVVAALLFSFNNHLYGFAHEVRAYSLFALLATVGTWQLCRMVRKETRANGYYLLFSIAMVYTHFFGWLMIGVHALTVLSLPAFKPARKAFMVSLCLLTLSYLPYATIFIGRMGNSLSQGTWLTAPEPEEVYTMIWRWSNVPILATLLILTLVIAITRTRANTPGVQLGLIWTFVPLVGMFAASYFTPIFLDRYLIYAAPGFYLLAALSLRELIPKTKWNAVPGAIAVLIMAATFTPWETNGLRPSKVEQQAAAWSNGAPILIQPAFYENTYAWQMSPLLLTEPVSLRAKLNSANIYPVNTAIDLGERPEPTIILVDAWGSLVDPTASLKAKLRAIYSVVDSVEADTKVWVYRFRN